MWCASFVFLFVRVFALVCGIVMWLCGLSVIQYAMLYGLVGVVLLLCGQL